MNKLTKSTRIFFYFPPQLINFEPPLRSLSLVHSFCRTNFKIVRFLLNHHSLEHCISAMPLVADLRWVPDLVTEVTPEVLMVIRLVKHRTHSSAQRADKIVFVSSEIYGLGHEIDRVPNPPFLAHMVGSWHIIRDLDHVAVLAPRHRKIAQIFGHGVEEKLWTMPRDELGVVKHIMRQQIRDAQFL